ncbi:hypothetical protein ACIRS1_07260 [Kitasatospora sp. NPDC101176]|uniref:hypothetical protein n=1 Tax=Kitasatospora sp. NPDC101176 TaxID=3364099 RepID=UPI00381CA6A1
MGHGDSKLALSNFRKRIENLHTSLGTAILIPDQRDGYLQRIGNLYSEIESAEKLRPKARNELLAKLGKIKSDFLEKCRRCEPKSRTAESDEEMEAAIHFIAKSSLTSEAAEAKDAAIRAEEKRQEEISYHLERLKKANTALTKAINSTQRTVAQDDIAIAKRNLWKLKASGYEDLPFETSEEDSTEPEPEQAEALDFNGLMETWGDNVKRSYLAAFHPYEATLRFNQHHSEVMKAWHSSPSCSDDRQNLLERIRHESINFKAPKTHTKIEMSENEKETAKRVLAKFSQELANLGMPLSVDQAMSIAHHLGAGAIGTVDDGGVSDTHLQPFGGTCPNIYTIDELIKDLKDCGFPTGPAYDAIIKLAGAGGGAGGGYGSRMRVRSPIAIVAAARAGLNVTTPDCLDFLHSAILLGMSGIDSNTGGTSIVQDAREYDNNSGGIGKKGDPREYGGKKYD